MFIVKIDLASRLILSRLSIVGLSEPVAESVGD